MKKPISAFWLAAIALMFGSSAAIASEQHLRLIDRLDRPRDGYCIDIPGTPGNLRTDIPLFAHNCKAGLPPDAAVVFTPEGYIRFPGPDKCVTIAGVNQGALPGAAAMLADCGTSSMFFNAANFQRFELKDDGKLVLGNSNLCLAVGSASAATYSSADRWRTLFVDDCDTADARLSRWEFITP
ncbi:MAG: hypothetical protein OXH94_13615 [Rhodospirillales bacterium]|nr:hypothetical protein [Rhodospirillales bacterium]